jgi:hypothetical protein
MDDDRGDEAGVIAEQGIRANNEIVPLRGVVLHVPHDLLEHPLEGQLAVRWADKFRPHPLSIPKAGACGKARGIRMTMMIIRTGRGPARR